MRNAVAAALAAGLFVAGVAAGALVVASQPATEGPESAEPTLHRITLAAGENVVQVAPDSALHPGGIRYHAMTFNGTIPGPLRPG